MASIKKRRMKGEGSAYKARGYFVGEVELERGADGKRNRKKLYAKTAAELAEKKRAFELERGIVPNAGKLTVADVLDLWMQSSKVRNRAHTYEAAYEPVVRLHLKPALGRYKARALTSAHVQTMINSKLPDYAPRTIRNYRAILRKALNWAIGKKFITENAAEHVDLPQASKPKHRTLSATEAQAFLDALQGHRLEAFYWTLLLMGMREAELIGQREADVDLSRGWIRVGQQIQRIDGKFEVTPTKGNTDVTLALPSVLIPILEAHIARLNEERALHGWQEHGLLFPNERGGPFHASYIYKQFKAALKRAGIDPIGIRVHDLRHTCASLMIAQGAHLSVIKERLRHSQISITADTYGHVFEETQRAAGEMLGSLFVAPEAVALELPRKDRAK